MKIIAIAGSLRLKSFNRQLAITAQSNFAEMHPDVEFEILEWGDVPLFNQDIEFPAPEAVHRVRDTIKSADGLWIFTPEYNHSIPGAFKNLIDWLSRPISKDEGQVLAGKPVAFCGSSPGASGTGHCQEHLVPLLSFLNVVLMNQPRLEIPHVSQQTNSNGDLELTSSASYLKRQGEAFYTFIQEN